MELCRASQPALIEIQTGANEACNQIRAETLSRLEDRMGIQATGPQGAVAKYLEFTSAEIRISHFVLRVTHMSGWKNMLEMHEVQRCSYCTFSLVGQ